MFAIEKNYRYKNYLIESAIQLYAKGSLNAERETDLRQAGFKFSRHIK